MKCHVSRRPHETYSLIPTHVFKVARGLEHLREDIGIELDDLDDSISNIGAVLSIYIEKTQVRLSGMNMKCRHLAVALPLSKTRNSRTANGTA